MMIVYLSLTCIMMIVYLSLTLCIMMIVYLSLTLCIISFMFCDVELFQNFLGQTDKNQISILSSLQWVDKL